MHARGTSSLEDLVIGEDLAYQEYPIKDLEMSE
jgi:hypothetical protein